MRIVLLALGVSLLVSTAGCFMAAKPAGPGVESIPVGACNPLPCAKITIAGLPPLPESFTAEARAAIDKRVQEALYAPLEALDTEIKTLDTEVASLRSQVANLHAIVMSR